MARIKYREAAGQTAQKGRPALGRKPGKEELEKLYVKELKSIREIAEVLRCTKDMVYRGLKEYGIELRSHKKESVLSKYKMEDLKKLIEEKGYRKAASDLGITGQGLWNYINRRKKR